MNHEATATWASDCQGRFAYRDSVLHIASWIQPEPMWLLSGRPESGSRDVPTARITRLAIRGHEILVIHKRVMSPSHWLMLWRRRNGPWECLREPSLAWASEVLLTRILDQAGVTAAVNANPDPLEAAEHAAGMDARRKRLELRTGQAILKQIELGVFLPASCPTQ